MTKIFKSYFLFNTILFIFHFTLIGQDRQFNYSHITVSDGLPENSVVSIKQDYQGFMWFGTMNGLVRYDGYKLLTYKAKKNDLGSISNPSIVSLLEDKNGNLWIGTSYGLCKYNRENDNFTSFFPDTNSYVTENQLETSLYLELEDKRGCIWIVTGNQKVLKFDPSSHKFYYLENVPQNSHKPEMLKVFTTSIYPESMKYLIKYPICESEDNIIWIGTVNGLVRYDGISNTYIILSHDSRNENSISNNLITQIIKSSNNGLWIGTYGGGLNYYDKNKNKFFHFKHKPDNKNSISSDAILSLFRDKDGLIWVSTLNGLNCFDEVKGKFVRFNLDYKNQNSISDKIAIPIFEDTDKNEIWFLIPNKGIDIYNKNSKLFFHCRISSDNKESISSNQISSVYKDISGTFWIGTSWSGLNKLKELSYLNFSHLSHNKSDQNSLTNNLIRCVRESRFKKNIFWIGTAEGLDKYDKNMNSFVHFKSGPGNHLNSNSIFDVYEDKSGILWIATYEGGLNRYDVKNNTFTYYKNDPRNPNTISHNNIRTLFEDSKGNLWIGTTGGGLNKFDKRSGKFFRYQNNPADPYTIDDDNVLCIFEDKAGVLWIGTNSGGLNKYIPEKGCFISYKNKIDSLKCISAIFEDSKSRMWIGTYQYSLHLFNRENGTSIIYTEKDGLLHNSISGIWEDNRGKIWLFSDRGISSFVPETKNFKNYDEIYDIDFNGYLRTGCSAKSTDGDLLVGSSNGLYSFNPNEVFSNPYPPKVILTDIKINDKSLTSYNNLTEYKNVSNISELNLLYWQNIISIDISALHFNLPEKNQYKYYLENFDNGWRSAGFNHTVYYTNLDPGIYLFHVRACNCDGVWSTSDTILKITITPPFWRTLWFRILVILIVVSLLLTWYNIRIKRLEQQKIQLETQVRERTKQISEQNEDLKQKNDKIESDNLELKRMNDLIGDQVIELKYLNERLNEKSIEIANQNEKLKSLIDEKNQFLGMVVHDLRNPLFMISGPIGILKESLFEKERDLERDLKFLERVESATNRMKRLIEDILNLSSIESAKISLNLEWVNYKLILNDTVEFYQKVANQKSIKIVYDENAVPNLIELNIDKTRIIQVIENILSNAIKFTEPGGIIKIWCEFKNDSVITFIQDNGLGLAKDEINFLFKAFKTLSAKPTAGETSTGLGLLIVKNIIDLHGGEVFVESEKGRGTKFGFSINNSQRVCK